MSKYILYFLRTFPNSSSETFVVNEMVKLKELGIKTIIMALNSEKVLHKNILTSGLLNNLYKIHGTPNQFIRLIRLFKTILQRLCNPTTLLFDIKNLNSRQLPLKTKLNYFMIFSTLRKILAKSKIDNIHIPFPNETIITAAELIKDVFNIPFTATYRAGEIYTTEYRKKFSEQCSTYITISKYNIRNLSKIIHTDREIKLIHSSIDLNLFTPNKYTTNNLNILTIGRLVEKKGISDLIEACKILHDNNITFQLTIAGDGILKSNLQKLAQNLNIANKISFIGNRSQEDILKVFRNTRLFVLPCIIDKNGNRDILPNVLKEAMACRVPVITTNICGIEELITHEKDGWLTDANSPSQIADAIIYLHNNNEAYKRIQNNSRETIEKEFNIEIEGRKMFDFFNHL